jgi:hypothetical protein
MLLIYALILFLFSVYSYALVDPNMTLFSNNIWTTFRNTMVQLGYYQRELSFIIYAVLIIAMFLLSLYFVVSKKHSAIKLGLISVIILLFSYPFLSHDFFNYLFDAKILTFYHKNPYLFAPQYFVDDPDLRFMHWIHRTYPYGPSFLLLSLIPSFLAFGKFVLSFFFFKLMFSGFYLLAVYATEKINKTAAIFLATTPLVLVEGLVNSHNDLIGLSLFFIAFLALKRKKKITAFVAMIFSVGIKYITLVLLPLFSKKNSHVWILSLILFFSTLFYIYLKLGIHPWYFLTMLAFIVFYKKIIYPLYTLSFFLLMSYYPYIYFGGWDTAGKVQTKELVIGVGLVAFFVHIAINKSLSKD